MKKLVIFALFFLIATPAFAGITVGNVRKALTASEVTTQITATSTPYQYAVISADVSNDQVIVVGGSSVTASRATTNGVQLAAGERVTFTCPNIYNCGDVNQLYAGAMASNDVVTVTYVQNTIG